MASINSKSSINIGVQEILNGISSMETGDLELFLREVATILSKRKSNVLSKKESDLFQTINKSALNDQEQVRSNALYEKLQNETISEDEHTELGKYLKKQESYRNKRFQALLELSQIRNISLQELMKDLGIQPLAENE